MRFHVVVAGCVRGCLALPLRFFRCWVWSLASPLGLFFLNVGLRALVLALDPGLAVAFDILNAGLFVVARVGFALLPVRHQPASYLLIGVIKSLIDMRVYKHSPASYPLMS